MVAPSKVAARSLLNLQPVASGVQLIGSEVNVATYFAGRLFWRMGRTLATALSNEVLFRLQASAAASGNDQWYDIHKWTSLLGKTTAIATTLSAGTTAGNTTSPYTSAASFAAGNLVYYKEGTIANGEFSRIKSISSNTITHEEAQTRTHTSGIAVVNMAEADSFAMDLSAILRLRLIVDTAQNATGQTVDVEAYLNTLDSIA